MAANGERAQVVTKPLEYAPHTCIVTGRSDGEVIDFGVEYTGGEPLPRIYIQRHTVEAVMEKLYGLVTKTKVEQMERKIRNLEAENAELEEYRRSTRKAAKALQALEAVA